MSDQEPKRVLFSLTALLGRPHLRGELEINHTHTIISSTDGEDAVVGRYVQEILKANPGFALQGQVNVLVIDHDQLVRMKMLSAPENQKS